MLIRLPPALAAEPDVDPASADGWEFGATRILAKLPNLPPDFRDHKYNLQWTKVAGLASRPRDRVLGQRLRPRIFMKKGPELQW